MAWRNVKFIRSLSDEEFARDLLEARRDFLRLRLRHELELGGFILAPPTG